VNGSTPFGDVAIVNRGSYLRTDGTTMELLDAAMTYFSAASNPAAHTAPSGRGARSMDLELGQSDFSSTKGWFDEAAAALPASHDGGPLADLGSLLESGALGRLLDQLGATALLPGSGGTSEGQVHQQPALVPGLYLEPLDATGALHGLASGWDIALQNSAMASL
jgi:hypothetical protein